MVKVELAKKFPLFEGFKGNELKELADYLDYKIFPEGEVLFEDGDPGNNVFFILKGRVGLYKVDPFGHELKFAVSPEGTPLGELAFFSSKIHSSRAVTEKETHVLILTRENYEKMKREDKELAIKFLEEMLKVMAARLRDMRQKFVDATSYIWGGPKK